MEHQTFQLEGEVNGELYISQNKLRCNHDLPRNKSERRKMLHLSLSSFARSWPPHSQTATDPRQIASVTVTKMETSQQNPVADVREAQARTPSFTIEIEETVFQKLTNLATKEQIPISQLASEILKAFLTAHHRELKALIESLKKRSGRE
jgi:citrate synthase